MRRMQKVTGRTDDMIILRGVNLFPSQIEELILGIATLSPQFQCVLERPDRLDRLTVNVECRPGVDAAARASAAATLEQQIKDRIGVTVEVDVLETDTIEHSLGKARRLLDQRPKG
jgi:phenylacetate-CoA ligase